MKICVIGLGYIGFPTACLIAGAGFSVLGVDVNAIIIESLNNGHLHIENEKGLFELSKKVFADKMLEVKDKPEKADVFIIAVPTPCVKNSDLIKKADLSYVEKATKSIVPFLEKGNLVVIESTVPPGATEKVVAEKLKESGLVPGVDFYLAIAPERVLPGNIMEEMLYNDRLIGGFNEESATKAKEFYSMFVKGNIYTCNSRTAEMVKLMENTYRDVNIALANEMALLAEETGVNVYEAIELANNHPRVNILKPGPGVGGHCIAEDPWFLIGIKPEKTKLILEARLTNDQMPLHVLDIFSGLRENNTINKVVMLGVSYKANVGDSRNSPGLRIAELFKPFCKELVLHDPFLEEYRVELEPAFKGADLLILTTDHDYYKSKLVPDELQLLMNNNLIIDTRGYFSSEWDQLFRVTRLGVGS